MVSGKYIRTKEYKNKLSETKKRLYKEGKIKPSSTCFKKGHIPWSKKMKGKYHLWKNKKHPALGKTFTEEHRRNLRKAAKGKRIGDKNPMWKGGVTPINQKIRNSKEYKLWRLAVFERDNYTCQFCRARNGKGKNVILNADHIKPFADYPELRFAIDNGRTLCIDCHKKTETYGVRKKGGTNCGK